MWTRKTKGEEQIYKYNPTTTWEYQKTFEDCRNSKTGRLLTYGFGVQSNTHGWVLVDGGSRMLRIGPMIQKTLRDGRIRKNQGRVCKGQRLSNPPNRYNHWIEEYTHYRMESIHVEGYE
jgi:hypothetical protein